MSASKSWVIGSSPKCDVVITKPNVSRRHCKLIQDEGRFFLEDLDSTNGTFVNGEELEGPVQVTPDDRILLASNVPFPWPDDARQQEPAELFWPVGTDQRIRIGRERENDVVLDYEMVSGRHALLTLENGQAVIEDLGSTNGTAINSPENTIRKNRLDPGDVVFFGSLRVPAKQLLAVELKPRT
jgi:pSer/pThr/pTyr-binding forkhead associated (FHA) protein